MYSFIEFDYCLVCIYTIYAVLSRNKVGVIYAFLRVNNLLKNNVRVEFVPNSMSAIYLFIASLKRQC